MTSVADAIGTSRLPSTQIGEAGGRLVKYRHDPACRNASGAERQDMPRYSPMAVGRLSGNSGSTFLFEHERDRGNGCSEKSRSPIANSRKVEPANFRN
jgi:hypothetical protein